MGYFALELVGIKAEFPQLGGKEGSVCGFFCRGAEEFSGLWIE